MKTVTLATALLLLACAPFAFAEDVTLHCAGTLIFTTVDSAEPDNEMNAVRATLSVRIKGDKGTFTIKNRFATFEGLVSRADGDDKPLTLLSKEGSDRKISGSITTVKPSYSSDTDLHILIEMRNKAAQVKGPMSCMK